VNPDGFSFARNIIYFVAISFVVIIYSRNTNIYILPYTLVLNDVVVLDNYFGTVGDQKGILKFISDCLM
jgi:hypothetical protein